MPHKIVRFATFSFRFPLFLYRCCCCFYSFWPIHLFSTLFSLCLPLKLLFGADDDSDANVNALASLRCITLRFAFHVVCQRISLLISLDCLHVLSLSLALPVALLGPALSPLVLPAVLHFAVAFLIKTFKSSSASSKRPFGCT